MKVNDGNQGPKRPERRNEGPRVPERPLEPGRPHILPIAPDVSIMPVGGSKATPARIERLDRVEISDAGRARASKVDPVSTNSADRLAQIRRRVLEGAYNADAVVADLARRILDRGDV